MVDTAKLVEVVDVVRTDIRVEHGEEVFRADAFGLGQLAIEIDEVLRRIRRERAEDAGERGIAIGGVDEAIEHRGQIPHRTVLGILQYELEAARVAEPGNGRRHKGYDRRLRYGGELRTNGFHDPAQTEFLRRPLVPRL